MNCAFICLLTLGKEGDLSDDDLATLSCKIVGIWKPLARMLGLSDAVITIIDKDNERCIEKSYQMLLAWKQREASSATYKVLFDALCHPLIGRRDLAENLCRC